MKAGTLKNRAARLAAQGLPLVFGLTFMLRSAGGVWGCVRCQYYPYSMRHAKQERAS